MLNVYLLRCHWRTGFMPNEAEEQNEETKKGGKGKLIIIVAAALLLGGGGAFFFMGGGSDKGADGEKVEEVKKKEPAIYVDIAGDIISPLISQGKKNRLAQIKVSFLVRGSKSEEAVKKHIPRLKSDLLDLLSATKAEELIKPEGKDVFKADALSKVQATMTEAEGDSHIEKVLFVRFVMQ